MDEVENPDELQKAKKKEGKKKISLERLRLATEKLQLARVRATLTLTVFGFTAYKIFYTRVEAGQRPLLDFPNGRDIGMYLIAVGLLILLFSTVEHLKSTEKIKAQYLNMPYSLSLLLSYLILILSLVMFITVFFRL